MRQCPQLELTANVIETLDLAGMYKRGLPPIAGGALDQAEQFVEAARMIWREEDYWAAKIGPHRLPVSE